MTEQKSSEIDFEDETTRKFVRWGRNGSYCTAFLMLFLSVEFFLFAGNLTSTEMPHSFRIIVLIIGMVLSSCIAALGWALHGVWRTYESVYTESSWYEESTLSDVCSMYTHCERCEPDGNCDICGTMDGRDMECVNEYASTCDGPCAELTHHHYLTMDIKTQLGYCDDCIPGLSQEIKDCLE